LALVGCGGSNSVTHVEGSSATITKPMLDHWMRAVVATDYRVSTGSPAPVGFASDPANYGQCAHAARKIVPRITTGELKLTNAEIARKCHQLYQTIRNQAMSYLLSAQWTMLEAKERRVPLSDAELHKEFLRYRKEAYASPAAFQTYMQERQLVLSDVLYQLKRNVLVSRLLPKFKAKVIAEAGSSEKAYAKVALERYRARIAKTSCKAGYVMEDCKEYRAPAKPLPSANVLLEGFVHARANT
jgi:hypothetical protein